MWLTHRNGLSIHDDFFESDEIDTHALMAAIYLEFTEKAQSGFSTDVLPKVGTFVAAVDCRYFVTYWK